MNTKYSLMLLVLQLFTLAPVTLSASQLTLMSPVLTPFGDWNSWQECPPDTFVTGFDVFSFKRPRKLNPKFEDDMGLVSIVLECNSLPHDAASDKSTFVFSEVGGVLNIVNYEGETIEDGDSRVEVEAEYEYPLRTGCNGVATGVQFLTQVEQVAIDNLGLTNIRLHCSELLENNPQYVEGYGTYAGDWSDGLVCRAKQGICGIQTLAESIYEDDFDGTGINNIRLKCCDLPNPAATCTAEDTWELIQHCDNYESESNSQCSYLRQVGLSTSKNQATADAYYFNEKVGFSIAEDAFWAYDALAQNFRGLGVSPVTNYDWTAAGDDVFAEFSTEVVELEVLGRRSTKVYQAVGKCLYFSVRTPSFKMFTEGG